MCACAHPSVFFTCIGILLLWVKSFSTMDKQTDSGVYLNMDGKTP
jgi:hypothetical protein